MNSVNITTVFKNELTPYEQFIFRLLDTQINNYKHE